MPDLRFEKLVYQWGGQATFDAVVPVYADRGAGRVMHRLFGGAAMEFKRRPAQCHRSITLITRINRSNKTAATLNRRAAWNRPRWAQVAGSGTIFHL